MQNFYTYIYYRADGITPFYVGKGHNRRAAQLAEHVRHNARLGEILVEDGIKNIRIGYIRGLAQQEAFDLEVLVIAEMRAMGIDLCNKGNGGTGLSGHHWSTGLPAYNRGKKASPETRAKQSAAHKDRPGHEASPEARANMSAAQKGHPVSPEQRAKLSEAHLGHKHTAEQKAKIGAANKGKQTRLGQHASDETKAKMSAAHMGRPGAMAGLHHSEETKKKMSAVSKGRAKSPEHRESLRKAWITRRAS